MNHHPLKRAAWLLRTNLMMLGYHRVSRAWSLEVVREFRNDSESIFASIVRIRQLFLDQGIDLLPGLRVVGPLHLEDIQPLTVMVSKPWSEWYE